MNKLVCVLLDMFIINPVEIVVSLVVKIAKFICDILYNPYKIIGDYVDTTLRDKGYSNDYYCIDNLVYKLRWLFTFIVPAILNTCYLIYKRCNHIPIVICNVKGHTTYLSFSTTLLVGNLLLVGILSRILYAEYGTCIDVVCKQLRQDIMHAVTNIKQVARG
jgi:hypothetical protein